MRPKSELKQALMADAGYAGGAIAPQSTQSATAHSRNKQSKVRDADPHSLPDVHLHNQYVNPFVNKSGRQCSDLQ